MTEAVITKLTSKWRYHGILVLMLCMQMSLLAFNTTVMVFYHDVQPHHCKVPDGQSLNNTLPPNEDETSQQPFSSCNKYSDPYNHSAGVEKCTRYEYNTKGNEWTVVSEWDLVCDLSYLPSLISSLYFCGMFVGALVCGDLADRFGRRPIILIGMYLQTFLGICIYLIENLTGYIILRTLLGTITDGLYATSLTLVIEYSPIHMRGQTGALYASFWGFGSLSVGIIAYFFHNWRHIQIAITIPYMFSCIFLLTIPESLRWLISKGRLEEAKSTVKMYARRNGVKLDSTIDQELEALVEEMKGSSKGTKKYSYLDLVKTPEMRKRTCIVTMVGFSLTLNYYGILFNLTALSGDKYENFLISAALEITAYIGTISIMSKCNRKPLFISTVFFGGVTCIAGMLMKRFAITEGLVLASSIVILISKSAITATFTVFLPYMPELFPTVVRNMSFASQLIFGRIGSLLAPQMIHLGDITDKIVPFVLFSILYFGSGVLAFILPETRNKPIFETIEDVEQTKKETEFNDNEK